MTLKNKIINSSNRTIHANIGMNSTEKLYVQPSWQ